MSQPTTDSVPVSALCSNTSRTGNEAASGCQQSLDAGSAHRENERGLATPASTGCGLGQLLQRLIRRKRSASSATTVSGGSHQPNADTSTQHSALAAVEVNHGAGAPHSLFEPQTSDSSLMVDLPQPMAARDITLDLDDLTTCTISPASSLTSPDLVESKSDLSQPKLVRDNSVTTPEARELARKSRKHFKRHRDSVQLSQKQLTRIERQSAWDRLAALSENMECDNDCSGMDCLEIDPVPELPDCSMAVSDDSIASTMSVPAAELGNKVEESGCDTSELYASPEPVVLEPHHHDHAPTKSILKRPSKKRRHRRRRSRSCSSQKSRKRSDSSNSAPTTPIDEPPARAVSFADEHGQQLGRVVFCKNLQHCAKRRKMFIFF